MSAAVTVEPCEDHDVSNCSFCKPRVRCAGGTRTWVPAKHNSTCPRCGDRVAVGSSIRPGGPGKWLCFNCGM